MMLKNQLSLKIAYLYPDFLQGACDIANLEVFKKRAQERNIDVQIEEIRNEDKILNPLKYNFYYISGSNIEALEACNQHLLLNLGQLQDVARINIPMLAINCGYILFGKNFQLDNSLLHDGLGILDVTTKISDVPIYSKIKGHCSLINAPVVGFLNNITKTALEDTLVEPFLQCSKHQTEGSVSNNVIGTYITSPILAQNPHLCDYLISTCLEVKYKCPIPLARLTDDIEWYSYNYFLESK